MSTPGAMIAGKFRLERVIGRGGMGSVWLARHLQLDMPVAIKFMDTSAASAPDARQRFEREARAAAQIRSPHVVQVLDHGLDEESPYIVMELLEGEDLGARLRRIPRMPLAALEPILTQAAKGLRRAHDLGIIHRDLKPSNIFIARVDEDEIVKLLDFGVAKLRWSGELGDMTQTGTLLGSPSYMSPEQARGHRTIDHRSDLWSLATIVFRAVTGVKPFAGESIGDLVIKLCIDPPPVASQILPGLPPALDEFFARAFQHEPDRRFQSALELASAFAAIARATGPADAALPPAALSQRPSLPPPSVSEGLSIDVDVQELSRGREALAADEARRAGPGATSTGSLEQTAPLQADAAPSVGRVEANVGEPPAMSVRPMVPASVPRPVMGAPAPAPVSTTPQPMSGASARAPVSMTPQPMSGAPAPAPVSMTPQPMSGAFAPAPVSMTPQPMSGASAPVEPAAAPMGVEGAPHVDPVAASSQRGYEPDLLHALSEPDVSPYLAGGIGGPAYPPAPYEVGERPASEPSLPSFPYPNEAIAGPSPIGPHDAAYGAPIGASAPPDSVTPAGGGTLATTTRTLGSSSTSARRLIAWGAIAAAVTALLVVVVILAAGGGSEGRGAAPAGSGAAPETPLTAAPAPAPAPAPTEPAPAPTGPAAAPTGPAAAAEAPGGASGEPAAPAPAASGKPRPAPPRPSSSRQRPGV
ncbi:MAG: protein kinase, partial [Polyangiaceae bacterium]|nr:protein kinase [Polyangiaceae bacterium]